MSSAPASASAPAPASASAPAPATVSDCDPVSVAVIGGGPAGLMAVEALSRSGVRAHVFDAMPSVGRKFLMAGKGGMNLTHSEALERFLSRYGSRREWIAPLLERFGPDALRAWTRELGIDTFVGSSGRVFPTDMKAAPMLRAWLHRLRTTGVQFHMRHRWLGWTQAADALRFATPDGERTVRADAVVLALGGGSWPRLGSDAAWVPLLAARGVPVAPLQPANCGFDTDWSEHFRSRYAGQPVKSVAIASPAYRQGEFVISATGIEGSLVYALSAPIRDWIATHGDATIMLDLVPALTAERVHAEVTRPRGARSWSTHLQSRLGIAGVKLGLLHECLSKEAFADAATLAASIKALPLRLTRARPIDEAISSAGGVRFEALDANLMIARMPGVFCAGEMLDWEAPTGGYLLTACFASGLTAGQGALAYLGSRAGT